MKPTVLQPPKRYIRYTAIRSAILLDKELKLNINTQYTL